MGDNAAVMQGIKRHPATVYPVLTPNLQGFDAAIQAGACEVAIFAAASESFSRKNINCSIAESLKRFEPILSVASALEIKVRGYVSCVVGCPYEGAIAPEQAAERRQNPVRHGLLRSLARRHHRRRQPVFDPAHDRGLRRANAIEKLAGHYHDTYGMAIANIYASLQMGMATFDSSIAGLGGCPYAQGRLGQCRNRGCGLFNAGFGH
jgi:hydroxymethylglutaryl-CoA lyase